MKKHSMPTMSDVAKRLEEMLPQDNLDAYRTIQDETSIPLILSERLRTRWQFREVLEKRILQFVNPDICRCGGLSEAKKIATLAETYYIPVAPLTCGGPLLHVASLHLAQNLPNLFVLETVRRHYLKEYQKDRRSVPGAPDSRHRRPAQRRHAAGDLGANRKSISGDFRHGHGQRRERPDGAEFLGCGDGYWRTLRRFRFRRDEHGRSRRWRSGRCEEPGRWIGVFRCPADLRLSGNAPTSITLLSLMKFRHLLVFSSLLALFTSAASAEPLKVGDTAPVVSATTDSGETLNLGDVYAKNPYTLVWFYPRALTGGCTKQGCSIRDASADLTAKGVAVVGVSTDTVEKQKEFKAVNHFPFPLLADTEKKVVKAFGQSGIMMASREAYLIKGGKIVYKDTGVTSEQAQNILKYLASVKS